MVQSIAPPPNEIVPAFKIRCLGALRCSFMDQNFHKAHVGAPITEDDSVFRSREGIFCKAVSLKIRQVANGEVLQNVSEVRSQGRQGC
jgi:hypothetical protein